MDTPQLARVGFLFLLAHGRRRRCQAQTDFSGESAIRLHEDEPQRQAGPNAVVPGRHGIELGDYTGLPINAAARLMADTWDASIQTAPRAPARTRGSGAVGGRHRQPSDLEDRQRRDARRCRVQDLQVARHDDDAHDLDGRTPAPPEYAPHTWEGFSTGYWEGNMLTVETTHLKRAYLQLNGIYLSDQATLVEHFVRHGNYLTVISVATDPAYLEEPYIRSCELCVHARSAARVEAGEHRGRGGRAKARIRPAPSRRGPTSSSGSSASAWVCPSRRLAAARTRSIRNTSDAEGVDGEAGMTHAE